MLCAKRASGRRTVTAQRTQPFERLGLDWNLVMVSMNPAERVSITNDLFFGARSCDVGNAPICSATTIDSLSDTFVAAGEAAIALQMLRGS